MTFQHKVMILVPKHLCYGQLNISESRLILIEPFLELNPWITIEVFWCMVCQGVAEGLLQLLLFFRDLGLDV